MNTALSKNIIKASKYLSFILRHKPESIDLALDDNGWVNIEDLIKKVVISDDFSDFNRELIHEVVATNDKKRFTISDDGQLIRANQDHSIKVDLQLEEAAPPEFLYHGTATRFLDSILKEGLKSQKRHHVHLTVDNETAANVGQRYGKSIVLKVSAQLKYKQGIKVYLSKNNVWLTEKVPFIFICHH